MKVVILCGGLGTRLREETEYRPKPLVEVGGRPILWHIMKTYAHYGFRDFVLCLGYRGQDDQGILPELRGDEQRLHHLPRPEIRIDYHGAHEEQDFRVTLADTGLETHDRRPGQADREVRGRRHVHGHLWRRRRRRGHPASCWRSTRRHGKLATVTAVRPVVALRRPGHGGERDRSLKLHREAAARWLGQRRLLRLQPAGVRLS